MTVTGQRGHTTTTTTTPEPSTRPVLHAWLCEACDLVSHPYPYQHYPYPDVIETLAATHNALEHAGWPAAHRVELPGLCESCQQQPTSAALLLGVGVLPFAVCSGCLDPAGGTA